MTQQGDVNLFQTDDDGDILVEMGIVEMGGGLGTAFYLSLFGGNEDDDGRADNSQTWWGNYDESDPSRRYVSETQNLLQAIPASSGNLRRVEETAVRDCQWAINTGVATSVEVAASIIGLNRIKIVVSVVARGVETEFEYLENWKAQS